MMRPRILASAVIALGLALAGCGGQPASVAPTVASTAVPPATAVAGGEAPPEAILAAEGGDPVRGQLGTYSWRDTGSDAPLLPGAPIAVGAGEPLSVGFDPTGDVASWDAVVRPAGADGPATPLGVGTGQPAFAAPSSGSWTLEVAVEFPSGLGTAHYFWRLDIP